MGQQNLSMTTGMSRDNCLGPCFSFIMFFFLFFFKVFAFFPLSFVFYWELIKVESKCMLLITFLPLSLSFSLLVFLKLSNIACVPYGF